MCVWCVCVCVCVCVDEIVIEMGWVRKGCLWWVGWELRMKMEKEGVWCMSDDAS